jgi:glycine hydroxymethyltransferase
MTTQGMKEEQADQTAGLLAAALRDHADEVALKEIESEVRQLAAAFPPYPTDFNGVA